MAKDSSLGAGTYVGLGCLTLFALPFAAVGVWQAWQLGAMLWLAAESREWVETPATVLSVELERHRGDEKVTFEVHAEYQYEFAGKPYTNNRVGLDTGADNVGSYHKRLYKRLKAAFEAERTVPCYVDPGDPSRAVLDRELRPLLVVFRIPFVVCFGLAGFGLIGGAIYGARALKREARLKAAAPDSPWLWREDWAAGRVRSSSRKTLIGSGAAALFWNAMSFPAAVVFWFSDEKEAWWVYLIVAIFPTIGIGLLTWFLRGLLRQCKYGESTLQLAKTPGVIGGKLAGVILAPAAVESAGEVRLQLTCSRTTGSGDDKKTYVAWQDERTVTGLLDSGDPGRIGVPVDLTIPSDGVMSTDTEDGVEWKLAATAELPGIDYRCEFEVPVFRTEDSRDGVTVESLPPGEFEREATLAELLASERLRWESRGALDSVRFVGPPVRWPLGALVVLAVTLVWTGVVIGMLVNAWWFFGAVFGFFGVFFWYATLEAWLGSSDLTIAGDRWNARSGWWGFRGAGESFTRDQIASINTKKSNVQSNEANKPATKHVIAKLMGGKQVVLVRSISGAAATRRLLAELRRLAGHEA